MIDVEQKNQKFNVAKSKTKKFRSQLNARVHLLSYGT